MYCGFIGNMYTIQNSIWYVRRILCYTGPGNKAACTVLTDGANLLSDLIRHGLMKVLELHTQSKVSQFDGAIG